MRTAQNVFAQGSRLRRISANAQTRTDRGVFFEILSTYHEAFLKGLTVTVELCSAVWTIELFWAFHWSSRNPLCETVGLPLAIISAVVSAVPVIRLLLWAHYPLQSSLSVVLNPLYVSIVVWNHEHHSRRGNR